MENNQDTELLARLRNADISAYEQIFRKYYKTLNLQAFYLLKDEMEAEDIVQVLFIEIWDRKLYQNINSSLKGYLQTAIHNKCLDVLEKKKNRQNRLESYMVLMKDKEDEYPPERTESFNNVQQVISELPMQRSQAFNLVYIEGKKYKEAATEMGITINSLKTHLKLAVKVLRQRFVNYR
jgi:RNA polymerase sigma-70 factor (family 1)